MTDKPMDEIEDLGSDDRRLLGLKYSGTNYVTFRKGHLQVDVTGYMRSAAGQKSLGRVLGHPPGKKPQDSEQGSDSQKAA